MCGLAGWCGSNEVSARQVGVRANVLTAMLLANAERGTDAAGIATICPTGVSIVKAKGSSYDLATRGDYREAITAAGLTGTIGHTRLATHGKNKDRNAHPFRERTIVGAHNGVIWNHEDLTRDYSKGIPTPALVDSQAVFRLLSTARGDNLIAAYARLLPKADGDLALTWQDSRDPDGLYLFRHGNPLSLAVTKTGKAAFWSSEMAPLAAAMEVAYKDWYPVEIKEDVLYRFDWSEEKGAIMQTTIEVNMPEDWSKYRGWKNETGLSLAAKYGTTDLLSGEDADALNEQWGGDATTLGLYRHLNRDDAEVYCDICDMEVTDTDDIAGSTTPEGMVLCNLCDRWWRDYGREKYASIEEAQAIHQTAGIGPGGRL